MQISNIRGYCSQVLGLILIFTVEFTHLSMESTTLSGTAREITAEKFYLSPVLGGERDVLTVEVPREPNGEPYILVVSPHSGTTRGNTLQQWELLNGKLFNPQTLAYIGADGVPGAMQPGNMKSLHLTFKVRNAFEWITQKDGQMFKFKLKNNPGLSMAVKHQEKLLYATPDENQNFARLWRVTPVT